MVSEKQNYLRDASVDVENQKVYSASMDDSTVAGYNLVADGSVTALKDNTGLSTGLTYPEAGGVYYAFSWTYTFKLSKTGANGSALFFDLTSAFSGTTADVSAGFRIGFKTTAGSADSTTPWFVWGNNKVENSNNANMYVKGTTTKDIDTYAASGDSQKYFVTTSDSRYLDQELTLDEAQKSTAKGDHHSVYLGEFTSANVTDGITVTAVAWYEGNDASVISDNVKATTEALSATMKFYVRDLAAKA